MRAKTRLNYDGFRGQCVILLLAGLSELGGRATKREVLAYLDGQHYFQIEAEDQLPFPSALQSQPRWELLIVQAAQICLERQCLEETEGGVWQLTAEGTDLYAQAVSLLRNGQFDIHRCFLWSEGFKKRLVPDYLPRPDERHRSPFFYHYLERELLSLPIPGPGDVSS